jgi:membrane associated rhomboid family serine protease
MFNAPRVVVALLAVLVILHTGLAMLAPRDWSHVIVDLSVIAQRFRALPGAPLPEVMATLGTLVTHQLLHGDLTHLLMNSAWLLAFGSAVARRTGPGRFLAFAVLSGIVGGLAFVAANWSSGSGPMVGASGALAGLMGGAFRFVFSPFAGDDPASFDPEQRSLPLMSLREVLSDGRAQMAIGSWVALNIALAFIGHWFTSAGGIAWEAHLGGFAFGLLAFGAFDRAGSLQPARP